MKRHLTTLVLIAVLLLTAFGTATAANPNPGVIPNNGHLYDRLSNAWWYWAYSFPAAQTPYFNNGGPVDISAGQSGHVWFLAGAAIAGGPVVRTGTVPAGTQLFFPLANLFNDYPCPDPTFQPLPGETLEQFLDRTGGDYLNYYLGNDPQLFAEIDGAPLTGLTSYLSVAPMITFTADPGLQWYDACITGTPQQGVSLGYWLLLTPLTPGQHTLHFGAGGLINQDITYNLTVTPGH